MKHTDYIEAEEPTRIDNETKRITHVNIRKWKTVFILVLFILFMLGVTWLFGRNSGIKVQNSEFSELQGKLQEQEELIKQLKENPIVVNPIAPTIELSVINSKISAIAELATVEYLFTDAARYSDTKQIGNWNIPFTTKSFILQWDGKIKAGIDINKVGIDVDEKNKKILVSVPKAEIISYEIDYDTVIVIDEKNNIFHPIENEDRIELDVEAEKEMKKRAVDNGLLDKAQENAEIVLTRLLLEDAAVKTAYTIEFVVTP